MESPAECCGCSRLSHSLAHSPGPRIGIGCQTSRLSYREAPSDDALSYRESTTYSTRFRLANSRCKTLPRRPSAGSVAWTGERGGILRGEGGRPCTGRPHGKQGVIWATDRVAWRLPPVKRRAHALEFQLSRGLWMVCQPSTKARFDGVLVEPCSRRCITWQRNPQAR